MASDAIPTESPPLLARTPESFWTKYMYANLHKPRNTSLYFGPKTFRTFGELRRFQKHVIEARLWVAVVSSPLFYCKKQTTCTSTEYRRYGQKLQTKQHTMVTAGRTSTSGHSATHRPTNETRSTASGHSTVVDLNTRICKRRYGPRWKRTRTRIMIESW